MTTAIAVDLGASSGRVVLGHVGRGVLATEEVARFANLPVPTPDGLHWDVLALLAGVRAGLREAGRRETGIMSVGIDSWAGDYGLLRSGRLVGQPFSYRDPRAEHGVDLVERRLSHADLFARTGIQRLPLNTVYQLAAETESGLVDLADTLLLVPDLMTYWLTGEIATERTNASTTSLVDVATGDWDSGLMALLGYDRGLFTEIVEPGSITGSLRPDIAVDLGLPALRSVAVGSHDTASAVVATPLDPERAAYVSCGTWSLVGVETQDPVVTDDARLSGFSNEAGVDGRTRLLANVMGLWILSESIRTWQARGEDVELADLLTAAADYTGPVAVVDVGDPVFARPGDMPARIDRWCDEHAVVAPTGIVGMVRSIVESLAVAIVDAVERAALLSGIHVETVHVVGGGARNGLLCQRIADHAGRPVVAGPVEATALGNLLVQSRALHGGDESLESLRRLVSDTADLIRYDPSRGGRP